MKYLGCKKAIMLGTLMVAASTTTSFAQTSDTTTTTDTTVTPNTRSESPGSFVSEIAKTIRGLLTPAEKVEAAHSLRDAALEHAPGQANKPEGVGVDLCPIHFVPDRGQDK